MALSASPSTTELSDAERRRAWLFSAQRIAYRLTAVSTAVLCLRGPLAVVGRRPYGALDLAARIYDIREMELVVPWLVDLIRLMLLLVGAGALILCLAPFRWRGLGLIPLVLGAGCLVVVRRALVDSSWTSPTASLSICLAGIVVTIGLVVVPDMRRSTLSTQG